MALMTGDVAVLALRGAVEGLGADRIAHELRVDREILIRMIEGDAAPFESDPTLKARLTAWVGESLPMLASWGASQPPFDHTRDFWTNFYTDPTAGDFHVPVASTERPSKFLDFRVAVPFGVPACALAPNSSYVRYFSERDFHLITYKTVRDRPWNPLSYPNWAFAIQIPEDLDPNARDGAPAVVAGHEYWPSQNATTSLVNSFGVPSLPPSEWQADVARSKASMGTQQVLIVSVMGSPTEAHSFDELVDQFERTALLAEEAGADVIELNLSCPNTGAGDLLYKQPTEAGELVRRVSIAIARRKPILMKIGYLGRRELGELMQVTASWIQGVTAINTVAVPVTNSNGEQFFSADRPSPTAGLSGSAIKPFGIEVTRDLVDLREREGYDYVVVGVGGVMTPDDYFDYRDVGADAVQSCSGAWLDPSLGTRIRGRELAIASRVVLSDDRVDEILDLLSQDFSRSLSHLQGVTPGFAPQTARRSTSTPSLT